MRDTFSYEARWDSVGLDCFNCAHFRGPSHWPDVERVSWCGLHKRSLAIELLATGYKCGEWFCRDFHNNWSAYPKAVAHFEAERSRLAEGILYRLGMPGGELGETVLAALPPASGLSNDR